MRRRERIVYVCGMFLFSSLVCCVVMNVCNGVEWVRRRVAESGLIWSMLDFLWVWSVLVWKQIPRTFRTQKFSLNPINKRRILPSSMIKGMERLQSIRHDDSSEKVNPLAQK